MKENFVWNRRTSLEGHIIHATSRPWAPFITASKVIKMDDGTETNFVQVEGFYADLIIIMEKRLNFTTNIHKNDNGSWSNMVNMVNIFFEYH